MARKVFVEMTVTLVICMSEGIEVSKVIEELECEFVSGTEGADVESWDHKSHEVTDSK